MSFFILVSSSITNKITNLDNFEFITTLNKISYDPLAKILRRELKDISSKISVVASTEMPCDNSGETLGSSVFALASAGIMIASYIINLILEE